MLFHTPEYCTVAPSIESIIDPVSPSIPPITIKGHWGGDEIR